MNEWVLISIALVAILVLLGIAITFIFWKKKKEDNNKVETDYRAFFIMGISFLPMGIIFTIVISPAFISFLALGLIYMSIGLINRDKWKKKK
jgi:4-amino-4-deoxy-L-arabinose transferase-like glycosyltransferase